MRGSPNSRARSTLVFASATHVWSDLFFSITVPLLPLIQSDPQLLLTYTQTGLLRSVQNGASAVLQVPVGYLGERTGEFWLLIGGNVWVAAGLVAYGSGNHVPAPARRGPPRRTRRGHAAPPRNQHGLALPRRARQVHRRGHRELRGRSGQAGGARPRPAPCREIRLARDALRHRVRGARVHGPCRAGTPGHRVRAAGRLDRRAGGPGPGVHRPARVRHPQRRGLPGLGGRAQPPSPSCPSS